ncbi:hypothetical protein COLO4_24709 [Corchorus olitorius]|uniref:Uncharacterized protein n=1 Tax=Corchorus olitorius TaxID=93759 RepID=A0A1R3I7J9_9ROSI|nr:hypothetical protein COLO4_24709 [Corchorus olitorius]
MNRRFVGVTFVTFMRIKIRDAGAPLCFPSSSLTDSALFPFSLFFFLFVWSSF